MAGLFPLAVLAGFAFLSTLSAFKAADAVQSQAAARTLAAAVDAKLGAAIAGLRVLASSRTLDAGAESAETLDRVLAIGAELGGTIVIMGPPQEPLAPPRGNGSDVTAGSPSLSVGLVMALREPAGRVFASGQPVVSDLIATSGDTQPVFAVMMPVVRGGEIRHALALVLHPASLQALLVRQELPYGSHAGMVDSRLQVLASSGEQGQARLAEAATASMTAAWDGRASAIATAPQNDGRESVYALQRPALAPGWIVGVGQSPDLQRVTTWRAVQWLLGGGTILGLGIAAAVWAGRREALREAQQQAHLQQVAQAAMLRLLGGMPAVIFHREMRRDGSTRLLFRSGDLEGVTGWPAPDLNGDDGMRRRTYPGDTRLPELAKALWRDGQVRYQWRMLQPDGGVRWLRTLVRVIDRPSDDLLEIVGYSVNITPEREAEARALSAARLASLGEMAAGLAHELKQPLQSMMMAADIALLAAEQQDHAEIARRLETIIGQAQRAGDLIERVRRSARGSANQGPAEDVDLALAVDSALLLTGGMLSNANVTVELAIGEPAPIVRGATALLEQVLTNLLLNAADALALQPPGAARRIRIAAERDADGMVRITVADTGGGIVPDVLACIFEPFVTTKGPDKGTGLGLSICHGLVTAMGGRIEARNEPAGAVFTVTLAGAGGYRGA